MHSVPIAISARSLITFNCAFTKRSRSLCRLTHLPARATTPTLRTVSSYYYSSSSNHHSSTNHTNQVTMGSVKPENTAAPGVPFYTPAQVPPAGTPIEPTDATLFTPIKVRSVETENRFVVSPMCMYSAKDGHLTDFHLVHLGQFALRGAGMVMVEATAVEPQGRITPEDSGLWQDSQIEPLKRIVDYIHSQNTKAAIQIAHAGRKASTLAPWLTETTNKSIADESIGGWPEDVRGPSNIPFSDTYPQPHEITKDQIKEIVQKFADTAKRAVKAGFDVIEIHGAHGYLISSFLSPLANNRTDDYGGSFENRTRFAREVIAAVRAAIPDTMPLWLRLSATEWMEWDSKPSWDLESTTRFAKELPSLGVDVLDVSSGGINVKQQIKLTPTFQTQFAKHIRNAIKADGLNLKIGAVGSINNAAFAREVVQDGPDASADYALVARQFLREPEFVLRTAHEIKAKVKWANQYHRAGPPRTFDARF